MHRHHQSTWHDGQPGEIWQALQSSLHGGLDCAAVLAGAAQVSTCNRYVMWKLKLHAASMGCMVMLCAGCEFIVQCS